MPEEGIVNYRGVCDALEAENRRLGTDLHPGFRATRIVPDGRGLRVLGTAGGEVVADYIVNCAGLHSDRVAQGRR